MGLIFNENIWYYIDSELNKEIIERDEIVNIVRENPDLFMSFFQEAQKDLYNYIVDKNYRLKRRIEEVFEENYDELLEVFNQLVAIIGKKRFEKYIKEKLKNRLNNEKELNEAVRMILEHLD